MKNFYTFINEGNEKDSMIDTIKIIMKELGSINCDIIGKIVYNDKEYKVLSLQYNNVDDDVLIFYYFNNYSTDYIGSISTIVIKDIYNYLKENYPEYEHYFTGKDMGLL